MNFFRNQKGFSLTEILIGVGIAGVAAIGGASFLANLEKNKAQMTRNTDFLVIEKLIESHLSSVRGCEALEGVDVGGGEFSFKTDPNSPVTYEKGAIIGGIEITGLKIKSFSATTDFDEGAQSGMAEVELRLQKPNTKEGWRTIPVAVIVKDSLVQGCNYELTRRFIEIRDELCSGAYALSNNLNCDQVIIHLRNLAVESVCKDIYGAQPPRYITVGSGRNESKHCDFSKVHAGKLCSGKYLKGFDAQGRIQCVDEVSFPPSPTCTRWGSWAPDPGTICKDQPFTQYRNCEAGMTAYDSRPSTGSKDDASCCVISSWRDRQNPSTVCTSDYVVEENNCGGTRSVKPGTKTDGACCVVTRWDPATGVNPADVCTTATYQEVNNCGGTQNVTAGTKDCTPNPNRTGVCICMEYPCVLGREGMGNDQVYEGVTEATCNSYNSNSCGGLRDTGRRISCRWNAGRI